MSKIETLEITEIEPTENIGRPILDGNLDVIKNVKVNIEVRVGHAEISLSELLALSKDSVIELQQSTSTPVDLLLDQQVIAQGYLVASGDNFGIQIINVGQVSDAL